MFTIYLLLQVGLVTSLRMPSHETFCYLFSCSFCHWLIGQLLCFRFSSIKASCHLLISSYYVGFSIRWRSKCCMLCYVYSCSMLHLHCLLIQLTGSNLSSYTIISTVYHIFTSTWMSKMDQLLILPQQSNIRPNLTILSWVWQFIFMIRLFTYDLVFLLIRLDRTCFCFCTLLGEYFL